MKVALDVVAVVAECGPHGWWRSVGRWGSEGRGGSHGWRGSEDWCFAGRVRVWRVGRRVFVQQKLGFNIFTFCARWEKGIESDKLWEIQWISG